MFEGLGTGPPESRRTWLVRQLRDAIATGELHPGDRLVERDISGRTGVSRGPVREAILLLEQEGLVVSHDYRGAQVAEVTSEEAAGILLPARVVFERFLFCQAAPRLSDDDLAELDSLVDEMERMASGEDVRSIVDADIRFHAAVIERSGWPEYEQRWHSLVARMRLYFWSDAQLHHSLLDIAAQHRVLLRCLRGDDLDDLANRVEAHIYDRPVAVPTAARRGRGASTPRTGAARKTSGGKATRPAKKKS